MSRRTRKALLAVHMSVSVGWIGAVVAYLALAIAADTASDGQVIRGAWIGMELVILYAITPLAAAALVTGIVMAAATPWGILNHYWVVVSLGLTAFAFLVLVDHLAFVSSSADFARAVSDDRVQAMGSDIGHPAIGLGILVTVFLLNMYKPRGLTPIGRRRGIGS